MSDDNTTSDAPYGQCSWTSDTGFRAWSKYGDVAMFGNSGQRATDVMLISAAACLGYVLVEYAKQRALPVTNIHVNCIGKIAKWPERLGRITTNVVVEGSISDAERKKMLTVCERACKVMNTLKNRPEIEAVLTTSTGMIAS
jgi:uncharacterized OsmC-like protein